MKSSNQLYYLLNLKLKTFKSFSLEIVSCIKSDQIRSVAQSCPTLMVMVLMVMFLFHDGL